METQFLSPLSQREDDEFIPRPKRKRWYARKSFWIPFILLLMVGGGIFASTQIPEPEPVIDTITVALRDVSQNVDATGRIRPKDHLAQTFTQSGLVSTVNVSVGETVVKNQLLAVLESRESTLQLTQAEATLAGANAQLAQLQAALEIQHLTLNQLRDQNRTREAAVQEQQVKQAEAAIVGARAGIRQAEAALESQKLRLEAHILRAERDGIVTRVDVHPGAFMQAGHVAVEIISAHDHEIEAFIPEADFAKIHVGDTAIITLDAYGRDVEFAAALTHIDPVETLVGGVPNYGAVFRFLIADERVKPGMTANIRIQGKRRADVLAVPQRALIRRGNTQFVRVLKDGVATEIEVQTGLRGSDGFIEITKGLQAGDAVIRYIEE